LLRESKELKDYDLTYQIKLEEAVIKTLTMKDGTEWEHPESNEERFNRWASFYNRGIISKMMKFREFRKKY